MYRAASETEIGAYIGKMITDSDRFKGNNRRFVIEYLKVRDQEENPAPEQIQRMQNRLCQMKKTGKGIRPADIPIFAGLLGGSVDAILSAGAYLGSPAGRLDNYSVAWSDDREAWKTFINHPDKPYLYEDEFKKTVLDYALEAGNYPFLKFLISKKIIRFEEQSGRGRVFGIGAATDIKLPEGKGDDGFTRFMNPREDLRYKLITLAIRNSDLSVLETFRARESALFRNVDYPNSYSLKNEPMPQPENVNALVEAVVSCSGKVRDYFFEPFKVESILTKGTNTFFFLYASEVIDKMIENNKRVDEYLRKVLEWNKLVLSRLNQMTEECWTYYKKKRQDEILKYYSDEMIDNEIWNYYEFYEKPGCVSYMKPLLVPRDSSPSGFLSNVIRVSARSKYPETQALIDKVNDIYNTFVSYAKRKEKEKNGNL